MATRNRYAEIMAQYAQSQPFSFFGYPQTYTGGFTANPSTYTGGFTPYQRLVTPQPVLPVEATTSATAGGGGGRGMQEAPSAWSQMTPAERAAYYAANPTEGKIALGMQDLLGNATLMGQIGKYFGADNWYNSRLEKQGLDPESFAYGPPDPNFSSQAAAAARQEAQIAAVNAANLEGAGLLANPMAIERTPRVDAQTLAQAEAVAAANARIAQQEAQSQARAVAESNAAAAAAAQAALSQAVSQQDAANARDGGGGGGYGGGGGGGVATGGNNGDASGGGDRGTRGGFAQGGHVSMMHLQGPNPMGPDDGYAALKDGEFVINDKAVKKYGIELMNLINLGKISKGKLRGLLEM
jgi:hypothetical protein